MHFSALSLTLALFASSAAAAYNYTCPPTGTGGAYPTGTGYGGPTAIPFEGAAPVNKLASPVLGLAIAGGVVMLF
ncbi:hypothetical protein W97_05991 [Coniosporium apollinis CBS 100218]|uniref:Uncharacterized protein n=1 Tax=Coniosporium apollinis (strain CBS 100218) TaxID=1168221 RepID=R7YXS6_CONA1|nr:uncharacterized protein W97_05991 [Coniosporium apollinis CBS 100218]EON66745.1 hypothetical protein W97_05991 [Coniosporium apollinis CBS 100218]